ncbi:MAG: glycosyl transferase, partial [Myxococcales bacterium]|nr:glycosyl transferase [Myxococcales bacterium]
MTTISVIIPIRDRSGQRLENCLRSLRWQQGVSAESIEVVLSDFGSSQLHRDSIEELAQRYGARLHCEQTDALWNRSRALNLGIQKATGQLCFCTDADMIFSPGFVAALLQKQAKQPHQIMTLSRCHDLPQSAPQQLMELEDFESLSAMAELRQTTGTGACQVADRAFFFSVRGYDEAFEYWGAEDDDM